MTSHVRYSRRTKKSNNNMSCNKMSTKVIMDNEADIHQQYPVPTSLRCTNALERRGKITNIQARRRYLYYTHWHAYRIVDKSNLLLASDISESIKEIITRIITCTFVIIHSIRAIGYNMTLNRAQHIKEKLKPIHNWIDSRVLSVQSYHKK